jgi:hypothetical protein
VRTLKTLAGEKTKTVLIAWKLKRSAEATRRKASVWCDTPTCPVGGLRLSHSHMARQMNRQVRKMSLSPVADDW